MTIQEMVAACREAMTGPGTLGVVLTVQKGTMPRRFPRGELLNEMVRDGRVERTYSFPPAKVIAWLEKELGAELSERR